jgi:uncharacterized protein (DUF2141 family)
MGKSPAWSRRGRFTTIVLALLLIGAAQPSVPPASVTVRVVDTKHTDGSAGVALWTAAEGFPEEIEHAIRTVYVPVVDGDASTVFDELEPGRYAVTVFNDRNGNEEFDKNWVGMPTESWGVSNNARPRLRAPRFDEAVFDIPSGASTIEIEIR